MTGRLIAGGLLTALLLLGLAVAGSYVLSLHLITQRQQIWCPLLEQIPPPGPHATVRQRAGYARVLAVEREFGC